MEDSALTVPHEAGTRDVDNRRRRRWTYISLWMIVFIALIVRVDDLDRRGFCHPENFVSGVAVPEWVKLPPQRLTLTDIIATTPKDGHPPLYFILLHPWLMTFGTSLTSMRLPSVLLGTASVILLFFVARREYSTRTSLFAAALVALNGHHIFWSQMARMYVLAGFLVLLATWLLWRLHEDDRPRHRIGYFLAATAALWTHVYCWPVILGHVIWECARALRGVAPQRALRIQFAAFILAIPVCGLALIQSPKTEWVEPILEYFNFGYLQFSGAHRFSSVESSEGMRGSLILAPGLVLACLGIMAALRSRSVVGVPRLNSRASKAFDAPLVILSVLVSALLVASASQFFLPGQRRKQAMLVLASLPIVMALSYPWIVRLIEIIASRRRGALFAMATYFVRLTPVLALMPFVVFATITQFRPSFTARGMIVSLPFLELLIAGGVASLSGLLAASSPSLSSTRARVAALCVATAVLGLHVNSVVWFQTVESSPRDYATFAERLKTAVGPNDLVFVTNTYADPPIFYYLPDMAKQFVPYDYDDVVSKSPNSTVWVLLYDDQTPTPAMERALLAHVPTATFRAPNCTATRFEAKKSQ